MYAELWPENLKGRDHLEDLGVDGRIVLEEIGWGGMVWFHVAQERDQWRAVVNTIMSHWVSKKAFNFLTS